ncbi:MAG: helix-turn-helix domain-containing protein [Thermoanaerobaculia bacterium]
MVKTLAAHRWNRNRAAQALGVSRSTLWRRMRELGVE